MALAGRTMVHRRTRTDGLEALYINQEEARLSVRMARGKTRSFHRMLQNALLRCIKKGYVHFEFTRDQAVESSTK